MHGSFKRFSVLGLALTLLLALSPLGAVQAAKPGDPSGHTMVGGPSGSGDLAVIDYAQQVITELNSQVDHPRASKSDLDKGDSKERVNVLVVMRDVPVAEVYKELKARRGADAADQEDYQVAYSNRLKAAQRPVVDAASRFGARTANLTVLINGVTVSGISRADAARLAQIPGVASVSIVPDAHMDLFKSVPFVGGEQVRTTLGLDGRGTTIAVIDSGVDYTHRNYGGPGTVAAYQFAVSGNNPRVITDTYMGVQMFPTQKIPTGWDFVGDAWNSGLPETPDPDPIDAGPSAGHGSHTSGIAAGFGVPNTSVNGSIPNDFNPNATGTPDNPPLYHGVAPGAQIFAYRVCSGLSTACSGVGMLQAFERSADPNQNGSLTDHADVINMSIGSVFSGNPETQAAANRAVDVGIAVAMSAGNSGNVPFISGAPGTAEKALSTAASLSSGQVTYILKVNSPMTLTTQTRPMIWLPWSGSMATPTTGDLIEARNVVTFTQASAKLGCSQDIGGQNPFPPGSLTGKIAVVERGVCNVSEKAYNAQQAGAIAMILVLLPGQALQSFSSGGHPVTIPAVVLTNADMAPIRAYMAGGGNVNATLAFANFINRPDLTDTLADFTSRGGSARLALKPDLAAPGSDIASTGVGTGDKAVFNSGTSMAAPHVAGGLALMKQLHPDWSVAQLQALLVNSAKRSLYIGSNTNEANIAPISLAGGGRLDLVAASQLQTTLVGQSSPNVYFGIPTVTQNMQMSQVVTITNHSDFNKSYTLATTHQFPAPGVTVSLSQNNVTVGPNSSARVTLTVNLNASQLRQWALTGSGGWNPAALNFNEAAGYIDATDQNGQQAHLAWYVLPHLSADTHVVDETLTLPGQTGTVSFQVVNPSALTGTTEIFHLVGFEPTVEVTGTGLLESDIHRVGVRTAPRNFGGTIGMTNTVSFAINTHAPRTVPYATRVEVDIDSNRDGQVDFFVWNVDTSAFQGGNVTGQNVTAVYSRTVGTSFTIVAAYSPADTGIATANLIHHVPLTVLKLAPGQAFDFTVYTVPWTENAVLESGVADWAPNGEDEVFTFDPSSPRFIPSAYTVTTGVAAGTTQTVTVGVNLTEVPSSEIGLLAFHRNNGPPHEAEEILIGMMTFSDVRSSDYFYNAVEYLYVRGIVSGYSNNTFRPYNETTRGQVAKIIVLAAGLPLVNPARPTFSDVPTTDPFYTFVESAVAAGIISGYEDGTYRPYANVTRGQLSKMVVLAYGLPLVNPATPTFSDVPTTNPFYTFIETAAANGAVGGYADGTFRWQNNATRGQIAVIIYRLETH